MALSDAQKFERVLAFMSDFFAMDNPTSSFNLAIKDLMEYCPDGVIVGGMAVTFYVKNPRTTKDVDIVLLHGTPLTSEFQRRFEPVSDKPLTVRHKQTGIEVDLLTVDNPVANPDLIRLASERFRVIERAGTSVRVASPEVLIALKLGRALNDTVSGLQDRADIVAILNDNPELGFTAPRKYLSADELAMYDDLLRYREKITPGR